MSKCFMFSELCNWMFCIFKSGYLLFFAASFHDCKPENREKRQSSYLLQTDYGYKNQGFVHFSFYVLALEFKKVQGTEVD